MGIDCDEAATARGQGLLNDSRGGPVQRITAVCHSSSDRVSGGGGHEGFPMTGS